MIPYIAKALGLVPARKSLAPTVVGPSRRHVARSHVTVLPAPPPPTFYDWTTE